MLTYAQFSRYDPTGTILIRNAFARDLTKRFDRLIVLVRKAVANEDVFGLKNLSTYVDVQTPGNRAFSYPSFKDKINAFRNWIDKLVETTVLETRVGTAVGAALETVWIKYYVQLAYESGMKRARQELIKQQYNVPQYDQLNSMINSVENQNRLGLLYNRTLLELKGVTDAMQQQISRVLAQGFTQGKTANQIARMLVRTIGGPALELTDTLGRFIPAKQRAQMIARTELIRTFHQALIQEYRSWGIAGVTVKAEWVTAGDDHVCEICSANEGQTFTLDVIEGMIPVHPNCRCFCIPVVPRKRKTA